MLRFERSQEFDEAIYQPPIDKTFCNPNHNNMGPKSVDGHDLNGKNKVMIKIGTILKNGCKSIIWVLKI